MRHPDQRSLTFLEKVRERWCLRMAIRGAGDRVAGLSSTARRRPGIRELRQRLPCRILGRNGSQAPQPLKTGDVVRMTVEGIRTIENMVGERREAFGDFSALFHGTARGRRKSVAGQSFAAAVNLDCDGCRDHR
jgi:hypothetical protein